MSHWQTPVLRVAVEPTNPAEIPALIMGKQFEEIKEYQFVLIVLFSVVNQTPRSNCLSPENVYFKVFM